jgi:ribosomal protein L36, bacterial type
MQVANSVRKRCDHCQIIRRGGQLRVVCSDPRHKQRQKGSMRKPVSVRGGLRIRRRFRG